MINKITEKDCIFFLCVKLTKMLKAFVGLGFCARGNTEYCLFGTKVHIKKSKEVSQVIMSVCKEHSRKTNEIRDKIILLVGDLPRI